MSPLKIEILLHHYYTPGKWTRSPDNFLDELVSQGLLEYDGTIYQLSELGKAHVLQIIRLPIPRKVFLDECGNSIDMSDSYQ